ncbi:MAG: TIGR03067 domain-containing protein [Thermoguttaceae bacterium]|nr:TIGR03067 domain-containing protein [Thermoguttaceae bacterium]
MKPTYAIAIALATAAAAAAEPENEQADEERIRGTWRIVASAGDDSEIPQEAQGTLFTFSGQMLVVQPKNAKGPGDSLRMRYTLRPDEDPKHIDTRHRLGPEEEPIVQLGIYALEKGKLKLALASAGAARPRSFDNISPVLNLERVDEESEERK